MKRLTILLIILIPLFSLSQTHVITDSITSYGGIYLPDTSFIFGVETPVDDYDAANKKYVDDNGGGGGGTVTEVTSSTTNQLTVANGTTTPALSIVTGAVADLGTALATGDQIYDFVTGFGYTTNTGTVTEVTSGDTDLITVATGTTTPVISAVTGSITNGGKNLVASETIYDYFLSYLKISDTSGMLTNYVLFSEIDESPLTTKGDLYTYSTTGARQPIGNNGEVLAANSSGSTGMEWTDEISIHYPSNGTTNGDYVAISKTTLASSGTLTLGNIVYISGNNAAANADADGTGTFPAFGIVVDATNKIIMTEGYYTNTAWTFTANDAIYMSATAGGITNTAVSATGDIYQIIGRAIDANTVRFRFDDRYLKLN